MGVRSGLADSSACWDHSSYSSCRKTYGKLISDSHLQVVNAYCDPPASAQESAGGPFSVLTLSENQSQGWATQSPLALVTNIS